MGELERAVGAFAEFNYLCYRLLSRDSALDGGLRHGVGCNGVLLGGGLGVTGEGSTRMRVQQGFRRVVILVDEISLIFGRVGTLRSRSLAAFIYFFLILLVPLWAIPRLDADVPVSCD